MKLHLSGNMYLELQELSFVVKLSLARIQIVSRTYLAVNENTNPRKNIRNMKGRSTQG